MKLKTLLKFSRIAVLVIVSIIWMGCNMDEDPPSTHSENPTPTVSLDQSTLTVIAPNETQKLTATVSGTTSPLIWISGDPTVVTVTPSGSNTATVAGLRIGTATVMVSTSDHTASAYCDVTVEVTTHTWTQAVETNLGSSSVSGILHDGSKFIVVAANGKMVSSSDGKTWVALESKFGDSAIHDIAWNGSNKYVAVGAAGKIATSTDGSTWTLFTGTSPFGSNAIHAVTSGGSTFVAIGNSGIIATWDGATADWTEAEAWEGKGAESFSDVAYGSSTFVFAGFSRTTSGEQSASPVILSSTESPIHQQATNRGVDNTTAKELLLCGCIDYAVLCRANT
jgi:hypothetical protein